jgi:hypothetical protein
VNKGQVRLLREMKPIAAWPLEAEGRHFRVGVVYEAEVPESGDPKSTAEVTIWKLYLTHK